MQLNKLIKSNQTLNKLQVGGRHDMSPPRPASGDTIYIMYAYGQVTITVCPCWPASTTNQSGLVTLTFDLLTLKVVSESCVTWATYVPMCQFWSSWASLFSTQARCTLQTDRRQTDVRRQTKASLNVPAYQGRAHTMSYSRSAQKGQKPNELATNENS